MVRHFKKFILPMLVLALFFVAVSPTHAQQSQSITVTPPLFQLTIGPGEQWRSSLKVVNNNDRDVAYYATVADFEARGESGQGKFIPLAVEETGDPARRTHSLASWIEVPNEPIVVRRGTSADIPFTVRIPADAEPGGHSAAVLIGTQPPDALQASGSVVQITSYVSSLFFVRVQGDVIEDGRIREFRTDKAHYEEPSANFILRFENMGNVHVRPQGSIVINNMWGKERGRVEINHRGNFGSVLPESIRRFEFEWEGERNVFDIGRYSAQVTLVYGEDSRKNVSSKTYFWVVPVVPMAATVGSIIFFLFLMIWFIRRYVRRALELEKKRMGVHERAPRIQEEDSTETTNTPPISAPSVRTLAEPIREGVIDLRTVLARKKEAQDAPLPPEVCLPKYQERLLAQESPLTIVQFFGKYKLFFGFCAVLVVGGIGFWLFFGNVLVPEREFEVMEVVEEEMVL